MNLIGVDTDTAKPKVKISKQIKEINKLIEKKRYDSAIELTNTYISEALGDDKKKDLLEILLGILNNICDKSDQTVILSLERINSLLDHPEYWIRQESLQILKKLYLISPNRFDELIEKIEAKLFDSDKNVRESAVLLVGLILKNSFIQYPELYFTFSRTLEDDSWTVRARALEMVLIFVTPNSDPPKEMIEILKENVISLLRDPDEEVRGLSAEVLKALCFHLDPNKIHDLLSPLLDDVDWMIREKAIWIIGEIGNNFFDEIYKLFHNLVLMFSDEIMIIQTKTIDSFVKIGMNHGPALIEFFKPFINDLNDDIGQGISETLIYITLQNMKEMLQILIGQLVVPKIPIRNLVTNCLLKIYMEKPDGFEEEIFKIFQSLNPDDWRQRKKIISLLGDLSYVLHIKSICVWTAINLKNWQKNEKDLDVLDEIESSLAKINNIFDDINKEIEEIEKRRKKFYLNLDLFQKQTKNLRKKAESYVNQKKFIQSEIFLEEEGNRITEKIDDLEKILHDSEFKRFSVEVIQDFNDIKEETLENISDVNSSIYNLICDGRADYIRELDILLLELKNRIDVVKTEYESIKKMEILLEKSMNNEDIQKTEEFLDNISSIREKLFKLEFDIGQTWLSNLEFKEFLKEITVTWIDIKIEIQQYLADVFQKFSVFQDSLQEITHEISPLKKKITYEFLNTNLQNIIIQAISSQRDVLERFDKITEPIRKEIQVRRFNEARNLVQLTNNNLYSSIEDYNREINSIYENIDKMDMSGTAANEIRKYLNNWSQVKDNLLEKIHNFKNEIESSIFTEEIKEYLKYINPISLKHLGKILSMTIEELKEKLLPLIQDQTIMAEIEDNHLIQPQKPMEERLLSFFRKVEIVGSKLMFSLRVYNPTKFFINDIGMIFIYPEFLQLQKEESDPTEIFIREFEPEAIRVIKWNFRISKVKDKNIDLQKRYELQRFLLNVSYTNPFGEIKSFSKQGEIIL